MRVFAVAASMAVLTSPVLAGTTYRFRTISEGSERLDVSGRVWVEGSQARREYDPGGQRPFDENRVEIIRAGEPGMVVLDLKARTFLKTPLVASPLSTLRLATPLEGPFSMSDLSVALERGQGAESVGSYPVRRLVLTVSYRLSESGSATQKRGRISARAEFWVSDRFAGTRLGFGDGEVSLRTGIEEVDAAISVRLTGVSGLAVKTIQTASRTMEGESEQTDSVTRRITEIVETSVAAARFEVPPDLKPRIPGEAETLEVVGEDEQAADEAAPVGQRPPHPGKANASILKPGGEGPPGLTEALMLLRAGHTNEALGRLKAIDKAAGKGCVLCALSLAIAYNQVSAYKGAAAAARRVIDDPSCGEQILARAYNELGLALAPMRETKDKERLIAAEEAFRKALTLGGGGADDALQNLVTVLYRLDRPEDARSLLRQLLQGTAQERTKAWARRALENPRCSHARCPSGITFVSADGESVDLETLRGKVVLITFWATWCRPCVESVPDLKSIQHRFGGDLFAIVGVNVDNDREVMTRFVTTQKIPWAQCWDEDSHITRDVFDVDRFPTEVVLDHEGVEVGRSSGWGPGFADRLAHKLLETLGPAKKARQQRTEGRKASGAQ
jgi:thiol-disulfide isomerase/thioredoxin